MLKVIAHIRAKPGHESDMEQRLRALVAPTRAEKGCQQYELFVDPEDATHFMFDETWDSGADWRAHTQSAHIKANAEAVADIVASIEVFQARLLV